MPTTVATAADLAQTVAGAQRWWAHPGNFVDTSRCAGCIELLGFPEHFVGTFTAGGSTANLIGIGAARQHAGERLGLRPVARRASTACPSRGSTPARRRTTSSGARWACSGMGRAQPALDPARRHRPHRPRRSCGPPSTRTRRRAARRSPSWAAPATSTRASSIRCRSWRAIAHERGIWFHVDGAYGGFGVLDERVRDRYGDVAEYDSFAIDPHKWLAAPVGTGAVIVRDEGILGRAFTIETGDYDRERARVGRRRRPGLALRRARPGHARLRASTSRRPRGASRSGRSCKEIGAAGMRARVARHLDCARRVAERARASDELELLAEPVLSICCFRYRPAGLDRRGAPRRAQRGDPARASAPAADA